LDKTSQPYLRPLSVLYSFFSYEPATVIALSLFQISLSIRPLTCTVCCRDRSSARHSLLVWRGRFSARMMQMSWSRDRAVDEGA
jgi:hypothetical protein